MISDTIRAVKEAEAKAQQLAADAREQAETLVKEAQHQAEEAAKAAKAKAAEKAGQLLEEAKAANEKTFALADEEALRDAQALRALAASNEEKAVARIMDAVLS